MEPRDFSKNPNTAVIPFLITFFLMFFLITFFALKEKYLTGTVVQTTDKTVVSGEVRAK